MPKAFDPAQTAPVLIDQQVGTTRRELDRPSARVRKHTRAGAEAATLLQAPIVPTSGQEDRPLR